MEINSEDIWKHEPRRQETVQIQRTVEKEEHIDEDIKKQKIHSGLIEISYQQLQNYGYCIISKRRGDEHGEEFESKYIIRSIAYELTRDEKKIMLMSKLVQ